MNMQNLKKTLLAMQHELDGDAAYLIPLRLFIGIGWIRASLEKIVSPGWPQGTALAEFFNQQLTSGHIVFPFYRHLITDVFAPHALTMSWIIMSGQMLVGLAVMFGVFTNFALLWGLFMNINFVLAGQITPSAFYIVIQTVLIVANAGAVFGLDRLISPRVPIPLLAAYSPGLRKYWRLEQNLYFAAVLIAVLVGGLSIPYIRDYSPHSVDDPAMLMLVLSVVTGLTALITAFRIRSKATTELEITRIDSVLVLDK